MLCYWYIYVHVCMYVCTYMLYICTWVVLDALSLSLPGPPIMTLSSLSISLFHTHTHTHTYIYIHTLCFHIRMLCSLSLSLSHSLTLFLCFIILGSSWVELSVLPAILHLLSAFSSILTPHIFLHLIPSHPNPSKFLGIMWWVCRIRPPSSSSRWEI